MTEQPASPPGIPEWDVADRMRKALRHARVGVQEIADYLDVDRSTVSTWINGRIDPSTQTLRLVAMRCGVSYQWLSTGETGTEHDGPTHPGPGTFSQLDGGVSHRSLQPRKYPRFALIAPLPLTSGIAA
jgi:transcriptional regulator with XRE-family HTH domain